MGTHNRLSGMGPDAYLEVIAIDPDGTAPDRPRWFDLDRRAGPSRLSNWIIRTDDIDAAIRHIPVPVDVLSLSRGNFRWRMAVPHDGILPFDGCFPALIQWDSVPPTFPESGLRMTALTLRHPEADALSAALAPLIAEPRITVSPGPARLTANVDTPEGPRTLA